jgi:threonylcarbamoyladenosine tRNA methylthiotransferase MtaB
MEGAAGGEGAAGKEGALCAADLVLGTSDRHLLPELLRRHGLEGRPPVKRQSGDRESVGRSRAPDPVDLIVGAFAGERTRATLKIQDGCEQYCAYCVIPYARGPSRSRPAGEVLEEASRLVQAGFREIVVTGIHLGAWGSDLPVCRPRLADLIRDLAAATGIGRLRLSSIEPLEVDDDLIDLLARNPRVCRHLHVPLQSGSDRVLARMNRHYTAAGYLDLVERVRSAVPLVGLTTDVMVGFPGETDEDFRATLDVVRRAGFARLHVFRFSRRPGTPAADMPGQVASAVKKARSEELIRLGRQLGRDFRESLVGLTLEVLVEKVRRSGRRCLADGTDLRAGGTTGLVAEGLTDNYARVVVRAAAGTHGPAGTRGPEPNDLIKVFLEKATSEGLVGRPEPPTPARSFPAGGR